MDSLPRQARGRHVMRLKVGNYSFEYIGDITPIRNPDGSVQQHLPQDRYKNAQGLPLNRYGTGPFCKFKIPNHHRISGVYILTVDDDIRYVGECSNLSARFNTGYGNISPKNCFKGGQETNCRLNNLVYQATTANKRVALWFLQTNDYKATEAALRATLKLAWNRI